MGKFKTEDEVRTYAGQILGFQDTANCKSGVGQITTFKQLGFKGDGANHKPDGWYLPKDTTQVAIVLETKSSDKKLNTSAIIEELLYNMNVVHTKYKNVIGILYNWNETIIYINGEKQTGLTDVLQPKNYYIELIEDAPIDTEQIYLITKNINDSLKYNFGVNDYYDRMVFTACALVAKRYGAPLQEDMNYELFHYTILDTLSKSLTEAKKRNEKLEILLNTYSKIQMNITNNQEAINKFIQNINKISSLINSRNWNGEDVMGIFFNEFNRYKTKSDNGQVFTPEHITSLMYRLINVTKTDKVLDAACGSGAFLTKSMSNMIKEAGGFSTNEAKKIMSEQLFGIEIDKRIFSLACANMLIHKDGKTNLEQMDTTTQEACDWIKSKNITKVLMNPPYERKSHPEIIIKNVLDNVSTHTLCAFLLPDKKLEKISKTFVSKLLKNHKLLKIIKIPEKTFDEGITTSIFIFESGIPQNNEDIFTCYISEDGLERVKNQGRQDIKHKWHDIENKWVNIIKKQEGDNSIKWIDPNVCLSYQKPEIPLDLYEEDFIKTMLNYLMFEEQIDITLLKNKIADEIIYFSSIDETPNMINIEIKKDN